MPASAAYTFAGVVPIWNSNYGSHVVSNPFFQINFNLKQRRLANEYHLLTGPPKKAFLKHIRVALYTKREVAFKFDSAPGEVGNPEEGKTKKEDKQLFLKQNTTNYQFAFRWINFPKKFQ